MKTKEELEAELKRFEEKGHDIDCEIAGMEDRIGELEDERFKVDQRIEGIKKEIASFTPEETEADKEAERQEALLLQRYGRIPHEIYDWRRR